MLQCDCLKADCTKGGLGLDGGPVPDELYTAQYLNRIQYKFDLIRNAACISTEFLLTNVRTNMKESAVMLPYIGGQQYRPCELPYLGMMQHE